MFTGNHKGRAAMLREVAPNGLNPIRRNLRSGSCRYRYANSSGQLARQAFHVSRSHRKAMIRHRTRRRRHRLRHIEAVELGGCSGLQISA